MKAVTLHLEESVYDRYKREARLRNRSASDLIREAMGAYLTELSPTHQPSLLDETEPATVGRVVNLPVYRAELLDDFLESE
ncbi:MAG: ribbon-helix-helix protein, CopG family [Verrucomicrobia bacterium]|nr:ribbon-helix-helix protein, CopG family [Verrucomicrobiota bacterium]MCH8514242.1 ribbon-helix-helix domain-containing protein [Kiritimatiellia bacterium]